MSKGKEAFIDQFTRQLTVELALNEVITGDPLCRPVGSDSSKDHYRGYEVFLDYAREKKWLSNKENRLLASGWATAARFLKR